MISRLTASAAAFAILATAALAFATEPPRAAPQRASTASATAPIVQLPRVEVTGRRLAAR